MPQTSASVERLVNDTSPSSLPTDDDDSAEVASRSDKSARHMSQTAGNMESTRTVSDGTNDCDIRTDGGGTFRNGVRNFTFACMISAVFRGPSWICFLLLAGFTLTMSTAGVAHVLHSVPLRFVGLYAIGCIWFIGGIISFVGNCVIMGLRFYWWPATFRAAFLHPTESLFVPAFVISIASILINITEYGLNNHKGGPWLVQTMIVLYWMYIALAFFSSIGIYLVLWSTQTFTLSQMTPLWIFPAYPMLLTGVFAGTLCTSAQVHDINSLNIIIAGFIVQGTGLMVSIFVYSSYWYRLMTQKLPLEGSRPAMFISVGPAAFTASAFMNMGYHFNNMVPPDFMEGGELTGQVTKIIAYWAGLWLWGLAIYMFCISAFAHWSCVSGQRLSFAMTWYAFIFPNTALITATFNVAKVLGHNFVFQIIGCVMTCILIVMWSVVIGLNVRAVALKQILWPPKHVMDAESDLQSLSTRQARNAETNGSLTQRHTTPHSTV